MLTIFSLIILLFSVVLHEVSHGAMANYLGDSTAKYSGRLTLNPLKHLDPVGSVILPIFLVLMATFSGGGIIFGWAKPVPINPYNFRDQRRGMIEVSLAGVGANFLVAIILGLVIRFMPGFFLNPFLFFVVQVNIWLGLFNLLPFPPLDGSKLVVALADINTSRYSRVIEFLSQPMGIIIAIFVAMTFLPYVSNWLLRLIVG